MPTRRSEKKTRPRDEPQTPLPALKKKGGKDITRVSHTVFCCQASSCARNGARLTWKTLRHQVRKQDLKRDVQMVKTHCTGLCSYGPIVIVCAARSEQNDGVVWYSGVQPQDAELIAREHLANNRIVESKRHGNANSTTQQAATTVEETSSKDEAAPSVRGVRKNKKR